jgi:hypothetical protein
VKVLEVTGLMTTTSMEVLEPDLVASSPKEEEVLGEVCPCCERS